MRPASLLAVPFAAALLVGCRGLPLAIPTEPLQPGEEVLGEVEGSATGLMLFQLIPIHQNERFQTAYERALGKKKGATRLIDLTIQEDWFWAWVLNGYTTHIRGTAVRGDGDSDVGPDPWGDMR